MRVTRPLLLLCFAVVSFAKAQPNDAKALTMAMPIALAPYVIADENSGVHLQLIEAAFRTQDIHIEFLFLPNKRLKVAYEQGQVDAVSHVIEGLTLDGFASPATLRLQNFVVVPKKRRIDIRSIVHLADYRVGAWQGASESLGNRFKRTVRKSRFYQETPGFLPVNMLTGGRFDAIIAEPSVFQFYLSQQVGDTQSLEQADFTFLHLFRANHYHQVFRSEQMLEAFKQGMSAIIQQGIYEAIVARYQLSYPFIRESLRDIPCHYGDKNPESCI